MSNSPGIGTQSTRPTRAQRREEAARVYPDTPAVAVAPTTAPEAPSSPTSTVTTTTPVERVAQPQAGTPTGLSSLRAKRAPTKTPLNTYVLASTARRLEAFRRENNFSTTDIVDLALQELLSKAGVPEFDTDAGAFVNPAGN